VSLDVTLYGPHCEHCKRGGETLYDANITHNLGPMADAAGIYEACWRPEETGAKTAKDITEKLRAGVAWLKANREEAEKHNAANGWGLYVHFLPWVERYLAACEANPDAEIRVSR
jgi:hypothetical protein